VEGWEEKAREEATRQAQEWLRGRLNGLAIKKNCVESMFKLFVSGNNEEEELEVRELKLELWKLEQEEEVFRRRLNERGFHL
jgi:hypothetical protein